MKVVAIIPARGGSKGVPGKNLAPVGGVPLIERAVRACGLAARVDGVFVSTDDDEIAAASEAAGASVIRRPAALSGGLASSESALVHALEVLGDGGEQPDVVVFAQCTSPFIDPATIDDAVDRVNHGHADSVFAAVSTYEFLWRADETGTTTGLNHDHSRRLRRQDRQPDWRETGAFYVMRTAMFLETGFRFVGRVQPVATAPLHAIEIDEPGDLTLARALAPHVGVDLGFDLAGVRALVTDFDGVHTDDRVLVDQDGTESVTANRSDGHGIKLLRAAGVEVAILSTERNPVVAARARKLGIDYVQGLERKGAAFDEFCSRHGIDAGDVAYIGNDVNDLECLARAGFPIAVADANSAVLASAVIVTERAGGDGAVREIADRILRDRANRPQEAS